MTITKEMIDDALSQPDPCFHGFNTEDIATYLKIKTHEEYDQLLIHLTSEEFSDKRWIRLKGRRWVLRESLAQAS